MILAKKLWENGDSFADSWNFGPNESGSCSVSHITKQVADAWGEEAVWETDTGFSPHEGVQLKLDCSRAINNLKWVPCWSLEDTIQKTVEWYQAHLKGQDMNEFTLKQIDEFQADIQTETSSLK
jgi:CDP-glucose 4,6-dehydratase